MKCTVCSAAILTFSPSLTAVGFDANEAPPAPAAEATASMTVLRAIVVPMGLVP